MAAFTCLGEQAWADPCDGDAATAEDELLVGVSCSAPGIDSGAQGGDEDASDLILSPIRCKDGVCEANEPGDCANPEERYYYVYEWNEGAQDWRLISEGCTVPPDDRASVTPDVVLDALRRLGLPSLTVATTPANQTLVNLETVFYTSPTPVRRTLSLLGQSVEVEATPSSYLWHFGDGESASTDFPGLPYPAMDVTHRYLKADRRVQPSVDTTYTARFRVNGGAWQDVDGTVTIVGPPITLEVLEATPVLSGNR
ncbi:MAG TPA: PKD domain-containing protein [Nocardioidaceae bacterium]|nr:PKD domain-containing protein [Nocardioidaceae bacterium]